MNLAMFVKQMMPRTTEPWGKQGSVKPTPHKYNLVYPRVNIDIHVTMLTSQSKQAKLQSDFRQNTDNVQFFFSVCKLAGSHKMLV